MIHVERLTKRYGEKVLFEDVSWHVRKQDRIGLSGPNGAGKTTLLRMLAGIEEPDAGVIRMATDTTIGYLPQDGLVHKGRSVREEAMLGLAELLALRDEQHRLEETLAHAREDDPEHEKQLERYADVTERFRHLGGYEVDARVGEVLKGLGFSPVDTERPTEEFSGGWQMRIALAKLLLARPNLLLMDEPTNHLDLPARNWLEEYLGAYPGSVVLVSHDRYFLDATIKRITEVGLKTLSDYHGNYSHYVVEHAARMERLLESARRQREEIDKSEAFINKFRYQATKARQVQSRIKLLDKVERIEIPPQRKRIRFRFPAAPKPGRVVLELKGLRRRYGSNVVLDGIDLMVERGDRIALVGPNGAGKSTLMRVLAGVDRGDAGLRLEGHRVVADYFAQNQAEVLTPHLTVHEEMASHSPSAMVPMIRNILGGFLFSGDDVEKKVAVLSGGERNRLALAKMLLSPSNLLLLDEPTNHLDLDSKEVLLEALADYDGTLVFVSHDRYFVDQLATRTIEVGGGAIVSYPGGYEEFLDWKRRREEGLAEPAAATRRSRMRQHESRGDAADAEAAAGSDGQGSSARPLNKKQRRLAARAARQTRGEDRVAPPPNPNAPRLGGMARPARPAPVDRETRRRRTRIRELEDRIAQREQAVKDLEMRMAAPGFYDDRARADQAAAEHKALMWEVGDLMRQWEALQEVETEAGVTTRER